MHGSSASALCAGPTDPCPTAPCTQAAAQAANHRVEDARAAAAAEAASLRGQVQQHVQLLNLARREVQSVRQAHAAAVQAAAAEQERVAVMQAFLSQEPGLRKAAEDAKAELAQAQRAMQELVREKEAAETAAEAERLQSTALEQELDAARQLLQGQQQELDAARQQQQAGAPAAAAPDRSTGAGSGGGAAAAAAATTAPLELRSTPHPAGGGRPSPSTGTAAAAAASSRPPGSGEDPVELRRKLTAEREHADRWAALAGHQLCWAAGWCGRLGEMGEMSGAGILSARRCQWLQCWLLGPSCWCRRRVCPQAQGQAADGRAGAGRVAAPPWQRRPAQWWLWFGRPHPPAAAGARACGGTQPRGAPPQGAGGAEEGA